MPVKSAQQSAMDYLLEQLAKGKEAAIMQKDVEVVREGQKIILPPKMTYDEAITWMQRKKTEEETMEAVYHTIDAFPLDAAYALRKAIERTYGWVGTQENWFGPGTVMVMMQAGLNNSVQVPWGNIVIPTIEGKLETGLEFTNRPRFVLKGTVKRKHREQIHEIFELTKKILREESVYRGQAIRLAFDYKKQERNWTPNLDEPKFMDLSGVDPDALVLETTTEKVIRTTLFAMIEKAPLMRQHGVPLKRGILLAGPFGTGKTMTANVTAVMAVKAGWTFIYLKDADDLADALRFAADYSPAVVFAEDIDRVMSGARDEDMDDILNTIDGVDTKGKEIITVLTTNHLEEINPAMLRPGRLDAVVTVNPPDARAVARLLQNYGRGLLAPDFDYDAVGSVLAGQIPATIRETIERAKAAAIDRINGDITGKVAAEDIITSFEAMRMQIQLIKPKLEDKRDPMTRFGDAMGLQVAVSVRDAIKETVDARQAGNGEYVETGTT